MKELTSVLGALESGSSEWYAVIKMINRLKEQSENAVNDDEEQRCSVGECCTERIRGGNTLTVAMRESNPQGTRVQKKLPQSVVNRRTLNLRVITKTQPGVCKEIKRSHSVVRKKPRTTILKTQAKSASKRSHEKQCRRKLSS